MKPINIKEKRSVGRPKLLTHNDILEAAIRIGLDGITMKKLGEALNVGAATIYEYFESRKDLIEKAAVLALFDYKPPVDTGQDWEELVWENVIFLKDLFAENPSFFANYQRTKYGFEAQFKLVEPFLQAMLKRGFQPEPSLRLFNGIALAAIGAAVETLRQHYFETRDDIMAAAAQREMEAADPAEYPLLLNLVGLLTVDPDIKLKELVRPFIAEFKRHHTLAEN